MHSVHRCGLLLHWLHMAWSVCLSVCVLLADSWVQETQVLDGVQIPPQEGTLCGYMGAKTPMQPFAK